MGIDKEGSTPEGAEDFKFPDQKKNADTGGGKTLEITESEAIDRKQDKAILKDFLERTKFEERGDFTNFSFTSDTYGGGTEESPTVSFDRVLEAVARDDSTPEAQRAIQVMTGLIDKRLSRFEGTTEQEKHDDKLAFRTLGAERLKSNYTVMEKTLVATRQLEAFQDRLQHFKEYVEEAEQAERGYR